MHKNVTFVGTCDETEPTREVEPFQLAVGHASDWLQLSSLEIEIQCVLELQTQIFLKLRGDLKAFHATCKSTEVLMELLEVWWPVLENFGPERRQFFLEEIVSSNNAKLVADGVGGIALDSFGLLFGIRLVFF